MTVEVDAHHDSTTVQDGQTSAAGSTSSSVAQAQPSAKRPASDKSTPHKKAKRDDRSDNRGNGGSRVREGSENGDQGPRLPVSSIFDAHVQTPN